MQPCRLLDDRLIVSGNLFYSDYKDSQRQLPDYLNGRQFGSVAVNTEQAKAYGLELSANYQVQERLKINAGIGLLETKIEDPALAATYEGNEFGAPGYMFNLGAWDINPRFDSAEIFAIRTATTRRMKMPRLRSR
ncbi:TonB-dependent receptor [Billgrantia gudaonensis]|uniref:TonB-dependent receptor n=1 Tax=Billgrantia gudaonensis TaxID=376427 RepID=A0A3S0NEX8_9GAMM|nr:TonB-dependent receptor [Halomonas gudaonensis]